MNKQINLIVLALTLLVLTLNLTSALVVNAKYITLYHGEEGKVSIEVDNNFNFDVEDISIALILDNVPFTAVGSSEKNVDDLDENDDDTVTFTLKASTDITPGDYNIPYVIIYINAEEINATIQEKTGSFGLRVSAKTDIDFAVESKGDDTENAIVGKKGRISLKVINQGLGEIKFVSVQIFPSGFELTSSDKIYVGTIDSDDSDFATYNVIFKKTNPTLSAKINYKDFDNNDQVETVSLPVKVYSMEKALELGLIEKSKTGIYTGVIVGVLIIWFIYRKIKKRKKNKGRN